MIKKLKLKKQPLESICHTPAHLLSMQKSVESPSEQIRDAFSQQDRQVKQRITFSPKKTEILQQFYKQIENSKILEKLKDHPDFYEESILKGLSLFTNKLTNEQYFSVSNQQEFITTPIPPGFAIKTFILQENSFTKKLAPEYHLYLSTTGQHLISAKNQPLSRQIFKLSLERDKGFSRKDDEFLATITCDNSINIFWIHSPLKFTNQQMHEMQNRQQLKGIVEYRKIKNHWKKMFNYLYIGDQDYVLTIKHKVETLDLKKLHLNEYLVLEENKIERVGEQKEFDIQKKVQIGKRNFELVDEEGDDYHYLTFKQSQKNVYELEIQHPLTVLQAFAITLTRFQACL